MTRAWLRAIWVALCVAVCGPLGARLSASSDGATRPPNIVFILADDHGPWAVGVQGNPQAFTPNLDRLANEGARLVNAFSVTPVCSPSRAEIMTSRYGTEVGITEWLHPQRDRGKGLPSELVTWPELLQRAGYVTGLIGKWHLGLEDEYHPTCHGYDYFFGFRGGGNRPKDPELEKDGQLRRFEGFTPEILTEGAIAFIEANRDRPFALSVHYRAPHAPWLPVPDAAWEPYKDLDPVLPHPDYPGLDIPRAKRMMREYLASVRSVDLCVGRLLDAIDRFGLRENTIVIYSSDHGYNMAHNGIWHKGNGHWLLKNPPPATPNIPRGQRPNMYDNSLRVPFFIRWPGVVTPGSRIEETVTFLDILPTFAAIAGVQLPDGVIVRGRNFEPLLRGERIEWDNDLYAEYSTRHQSRTHMRCYRTPEWKLVRDFLNPGRDELYHLTVDPEERSNLIDSDDPEVQRVLARLHDKIIENMRAIADPVLELVEAQRR